MYFSKWTKKARYLTCPNFKECEKNFCHCYLSSVAQLCPTLCDPMNCSTPGLSVHHQLKKFTQTHVHQVGDTIHPAISSSVVPFSSCPQSLPASGFFQTSQLFTWGGQSIGVSALASVLLMNTQNWFSLEWLVRSPCSPRDSQESLQHHSSTASILRRSAFFIVQLSHPYVTTGKKHSFD